jgi:hypothetical protein
MKKIESVLSLTDLSDEILAHLKQWGHNVSSLRDHSVDSHLRLAMRHLGFRPTETAEAKTNILQLAEQLDRCLKSLNGEAPEGQEEMVRAYLTTTLSNLNAERRGIANLAALLKDVPPPAALALLLLGLFLWFAPSAKADSFNTTNALGSTTVLLSWPTNTAAGTNGFYRLTGGPIEVRNFSEGVGFYAGGYSTTNTNSTITVKLVRSWADHPPVVILDTNGVIQTNDFENTPGITLAFSSLGSGPQWWGTNLDPYILGNCTYVGIYSMTNANAGANANWTNANFGLKKNVRNRALTAGNF